MKTVTGGATVLQREHMKRIFLGQSIFSTGGGYSQTKQNQILDSSPIESVKLQSLHQFDPNTYVCSICSVGTARKSPVAALSMLKSGFHVLEALTGRSLQGIFSVEPGVDILGLVAAHELSVPLVDADSCGGRAVPFANCDDFCLAGRSLCPAVVLTESGDILTINHSSTDQKLEEYLRSFARSDSGLVVVLDHLIRVGEAFQLLSQDTVQRALKVGSILSESSSADIKLSKLLSATHAQVLGKGKIIEIQTSNASHAGHTETFLNGQLKIRTKQNSLLRITFHNENLLCYEDERLIRSCPDLISLVDSESLAGIHNTEIHEEMDVTVIAIPCQAKWRSPRGIELFGPRRFGYSNDPVLSTEGLG